MRLPAACPPPAGIDPRDDFAVERGPSLAQLLCFLTAYRQRSVLRYLWSRPNWATVNNPALRDNDVHVVDALWDEFPECARPAARPTGRR